MNFRALKGTIMMAICGAAALFAAGMLLYILVVIFLKGVASLKPHFILFSEINTGMGLGTGVGNAIAGTILLAVISTILAIPFGVGTAIYLRKYASDNQFTRFLRLMIEVLSGTPSICTGNIRYRRPCHLSQTPHRWRIPHCRSHCAWHPDHPGDRTLNRGCTCASALRTGRGQLCTRRNQMADNPGYRHPLCLIRDYRRGHPGIREGSRRVCRRSPDRRVFPVHAAIQDCSQPKLFTRD